MPLKSMVSNRFIKELNKVIYLLLPNTFAIGSNSIGHTIPIDSGSSCRELTRKPGEIFPAIRNDLSQSFTYLSCDLLKQFFVICCTHDLTFAF